MGGHSKFMHLVTLFFCFGLLRAKPAVPCTALPHIAMCCIAMPHIPQGTAGLECSSSGVADHSGTGPVPGSRGSVAVL